MIFDNGYSSVNGLLLQFSGKESTCNAGDAGLNPWVRKIPWRRAWQPTPVFLPGESHGQSRLEVCSPQCRKEWNMTEVTEHAQLCEHYPKQNLEHLHHPGKSPIDIFSKPDLSGQIISYFHQLRLAYVPLGFYMDRIMLHVLIWASFYPQNNIYENHPYFMSISGSFLPMLSNINTHQLIYPFTY